MKDITMCQDNECPMRKECFRYKKEFSEDDVYESYFIESPRKGNVCDYFNKISISI
jgi:hypothetical protein